MKIPSVTNSAFAPMRAKEVAPAPSAELLKRQIKPIELQLRIVNDPAKINIGFAFLCINPTTKYHAIIAVLNRHHALVERALRSQDSPLTAFLYCVLVAELIAARRKEGPIGEVHTHLLAKLTPAASSFVALADALAKRLVESFARLAIYGANTPSEIAPLIIAMLEAQ